MQTEYSKQHQQIGDAIAAGKRKLFEASKSDGDLRRAADRFITELTNRLADIIPAEPNSADEKDSEGQDNNRWQKARETDVMVRQLAAASVCPGEEKQQAAVIAMLELIATSESGYAAPNLACSALQAAFAKSECLIDESAARVLANIQIGSDGTVSLEGAQ